MAVTIIVQSPAGYDFDSFFDHLADVDNPPSGSSSGAIVVNTTADIRFEITGTALTYDSEGFNGGTIDTISIVRASDNTELVSVNFLADGGLDANSFNNAVEAYVASGKTDPSALDAILSAFAYNFTGNTSDDSFGGGTLGDTLVGGGGNDELEGESGDDSIDGGSGDDTIDGGEGNDTLDGGSNTGRGDWADYGSASAAVTVDLAAGTATGAHGNDTLTNFENIIGGSANDVLIGDAGSNIIAGGFGADTIDGGAGFDFVTYSAAGSAVTVNLTKGAGPAGDVITNIEGIVGSNFGDLLIGDAATNVLRGGPGNDTLDGKDGLDFADYKAATAAVTVNLAGNTSSGPDGEDTFISIEAIRGSNFNDLLIGDANGNFLRGGTGNDTLNGKEGSDWADYFDATGSVTVDLITKTSSGADGNDSLISIENARGSAFDDVLIGNNADNFLRGGKGNDTLDGKGGSDWASYRDASGSVTVSLITGTSSGADGNDKLWRIENISGSFFDDVLTGNGLDNVLQGGPGNDTLDGKGGSDWANYFDASGAVTVSLITKSSSGAAGNDTLISIENIRGSAFDDVLTGNALNNTLYGGTGNDTLDGRAGFDTASYRDATGAVTVNLSTKTASGADGNDTLIAIEDIRGSAFDDVLTGNSVTNFLNGGPGNDTIDGKGGSDWVTYQDATGSVTVDLVANTASGAAGNDTLISIENIRGSAFADVLSGNGGANALQGGLGDDTLDGKAGFDWASYQFATGAVTVNLATGTASGADGNDTLLRIESVLGSAFNDTLTGNAQANTLDGGAGADTLTGGAGNDVFVFKAGEADGDVLTDFNGNGSNAGDSLLLVGYAPGATITSAGGNDWLIDDGVIQETITLSNGASLDPSDFVFV